MEGTKIGRYHQLTTQAAQYEREGELEHAAKLWRKAADNASGRNQPKQAAFCKIRAEFCDAALKRQQAYPAPAGKAC